MKYKVNDAIVINSYKFGKIKGIVKEKHIKSGTYKIYGIDGYIYIGVTENQIEKYKKPKNHNHLLTSIFV